jgi:hypothetical protein
MEAGRRSVRTEPTIAKRCPLNFEEARSQWEVEKKKFLGANFGCLRDVSPAVLKAFRAALSEGPEEAIQKVITANPYLIQYAVARSGHQGIWVYPKCPNLNRVSCIVTHDGSARFKLISLRATALRRCKPTLWRWQS